MLLKTVLGLVLGISSLVGLVFTCVAFWAVILIARRPKSSVIYIMAASNLFIDIFHLLLMVFYLAPSIVFNSFLFTTEKNGPTMRILGTIFLFGWYNGSVVQMLVAINRCVVLCFPRVDFFTKKVVLGLVLGLYPIAIFFAVFSQYISPCCTFSFDHEYLSYSYRPQNDTPNYSNQYVDLPLNTASSATCAFCYIAIVIYVYRMSSLQSSFGVSRDRRHREYIYALQFSAISVFYLFSWMFFRIFPLFIPSIEGAEHLFIVIPLCVVVNSGANAAIYLVTNKEVRNSVRHARIGYTSSVSGINELNPTQSAPSRSVC